MRILAAFLVLLIGIVLLIGLAPIADELSTIVDGLDTVTGFEMALFAFWKYILAGLLFIAVLAILIKPDIITGLFRKDK